MRCNQFEQRLQMLLDARAVPEDDMRLTAHATLCSDCHELMVGQQVLMDALAISAPAEPDGDFAERVVARVITTMPSRRRRSWRTVSIVLAVSAAVMLLIAGSVARWRAAPDMPRTLPQSAVATRTGPPMGGAAAAADVAAGSNIWKVLTPQTLEEIYPPQVRRRHLEEVDRFANDLRPIARSFTAAAAALRRTFPVSRQRTPKGRPQAKRQMPNRLAGWV